MHNSSVEYVNLPIQISQPTDEWLKEVAISLENSAENVALYFLAARFKEPIFCPRGLRNLPPSAAGERGKVG